MKDPQLKPFKSGKYHYLYIRWKHLNDEIRYNTGYHYKSAYHTVDYFFNSKYPNYKQENEKLQNLLERTKKYIDACKKNDKKINNKQLKQYLKGELHLDHNHPFYSENLKIEVDINSSQSFFLIFGKFYGYKSISLKSKYSFKDYKSLMLLLNEYNRVNEITIAKMDTMEFAPQLARFLYEERGMSDNTVYKRFQTIRSFMLWLQDNDIYQFKQSSFKFKPKKYQSTQYALTTDEVDFLFNFEPVSKFQRKIIDIFRLQCLTALPYSDLKQLNKDDINFTTKPATLKYVRTKTNEECIAPLSSRVLEILERYKYELPIPTQQHFNREVKEILSDIKTFTKKIKTVDYINGKQIINYIEKYKLIGSHTGRRTFVTVALSKGAGINTIQSVTGHKSITMIQKYAKKVDNLAIFDE